MLFCIVTFNLWLHYNKLLTYLLTYNLIEIIARTCWRIAQMKLHVQLKIVKIRSQSYNHV